MQFISIILAYPFFIMFFLKNADHRFFWLPFTSTVQFGSGLTNHSKILMFLEIFSQFQWSSFISTHFFFKNLAEGPYHDALFFGKFARYDYRCVLINELHCTDFIIMKTWRGKVPKNRSFCIVMPLLLYILYQSQNLLGPTYSIVLLLTFTSI